MKPLVIASLLISLFITAYCYLEYQLPHSQYLKALSDLKTAGVTDKELIKRIRWDILGVQTTWTPLLVANVVQNMLLVFLFAKIADLSKMTLRQFRTKAEDPVAE